MKIAIIGTGYVGLVTGACLAEQGHEVICVDRDQKKINRLKQGVVPFFEPGLPELVKQCVSRNTLKFTHLLSCATPGADVVFVAVGTPPGPDGAPDLQGLDNCMAQLVDQLHDDVVVAVKSTVPPGTCERLQQLFDAATDRRGTPAQITVVSNPEFLSEGRAIENFRYPERIVVGTSDPGARLIMQRLYQPFDPSGTRSLFMGTRSAELAKYACNAMLAARVSMVNEIARIAGCTGADVADVCAVMRSDPRIGPHYLEAGVGYGGSCLPKDLRALMHTARDHGAQAPLLAGIEQSNEAQARLLAMTIERCLGGLLRQRRVAVWGLAFKPDTDDTRAAPSLVLIRHLLQAGARVHAYDPAAMPAASCELSHPRLVFASSALAACEDADVLVVMTQWDQFAEPDFAALAQAMRGDIVVDGRQIYQPDVLSGHGLRHLLPWQGYDATQSAGRATHHTDVASAM